MPNNRAVDADQIIPTKIALTFLLGFVAAILPLATGAIIFTWSAWIFIGGLISFIAVMLFVRPLKQMKFRDSRWSILSVLLFGYGVGALVYFYRDWFKWVWQNARRIDDPLLASMVLLGVILGFFVVRNWPKQQKEFIESLAAIFGGTFIATLMGKVAGGDSIRFLSHYAIGFTASGAVNLLFSSLLLAHYTNSKSRISRAIVAFLYGNDKTKEVDKSFQKNFEEDQDYAKRLLTETLKRYGERVKAEFAKRKEKQRENLTRRHEKLKPFKSDIDSKLNPQAPNNKELAEGARNVLSEIFPGYEDLLKEGIEVRGKLAGLISERANLKAKEEELKKESDQARIKSLQGEIAQLRKAGELESEISQLEARLSFVRETLNGTRNSYYYELTSINRDASAKPQPTARSANQAEDETVYIVGFKVIDKIEASMFRIGITVKWQDALEYIVTPGQYRQPFPYRESVAGLALTAQETIIMDRDRDKSFRSASFMDGKTPSEAEQKRGLDEINYLSYISVPVVSAFTNSEEGSLGVVNIDTKLFVASVPPQEMPNIQWEETGWTMRCKREQLSEYSANLYEQNDDTVEYLENVRTVIVPVLELYLHCRQGAS